MRFDVSGKLRAGVMSLSFSECNERDGFCIHFLAERCEGPRLSDADAWHASEFGSHLAPAHRAPDHELEPERIVNVLDEIACLRRIAAGATANGAKLDVGVKQVCVFDFVVDTRS